MTDELSRALAIYNQANAAMDCCLAVEGHLKVAQGLGIWDIFGGGFVASMLKRSKMQDASSRIRELKIELSRLKNLFDVDTSTFFLDTDLEFNDLAVAFDVIFDNIFSDLSAQKRISDALYQVRELKAKLERLIGELENRYTFN